MKKKLRYILLFLLTVSSWVFSSVSAGYVEAGSPVSSYFMNEFEKAEIPVIQDDAMEIQPVDRIDLSADATNTNLSYWLEKLPDEHKQRKEYILIGKTIIPLINPTQDDREAIDQGKGVEYHHYLENGAFRHYGKKPREGNGNMVFAAHSSWYKHIQSDFKTIGQAILLAKPGEKVQYYRKWSSTSYVRYEYLVQTDGTVQPTENRILTQPSDRNMLTMYACNPVGSTAERGYFQATLLANYFETL